MSYQIDSRNLAAIRKEIKDNIISKLEETKPETGVVSIVYGDRTDIGNINMMPVVWILPSSHQPELRGGHTATHDFLFDFICMVHDLDSEIGRETAEDITAKVYDVISLDRTLNGKVFDVRPLNFDPSFEAAANSSVYWASCQFAFRIQRRE
ncbi:hypothetical protein [Risungbinella massiliensis]|uniref:hypothetical protein n=1 Tax=Risungbinella massiliensis TaxID=1329796 RepID=UPI0005CBF122|nr:hypothetical protein [Risungbinella massiliensis]